MCTISEEDLEYSGQCMETKSSRDVNDAVCKKCGDQKVVVVLRVKDTYCRVCFLSSVTHKFRGTLGKSRLLKTNENVLIALSGSQSSLALVHLVKEGLDERSHKRLQCTPHAVYIDEGAVLGHSINERQEICKSLACLMKPYSIPTFVSSLGKVIESHKCHSEMYISLHEDTLLEIDGVVDTRIQNLFLNISSMSSKQDLLEKLRHRLLVLIARRLKCSKIFVGDTETDLAIRVISNVSLGRGSNLPLDVAFCDTRHPDVQILRPMRDIMRKEVSMYNAFHCIDSVYYSSLLTKTDPFSSIQKLTEKFVVELQDEFPSTVSTIYRTGNKLSLENNSHDVDDTCLLCQAPLDTSSQTSSALQATEFSRLVSTLGPSAFKPDLSKMPHETAISPVCDSDEASSNCTDDRKECICRLECQNKKSPQINYLQISETLCYGCRLIVREMNVLEHLPEDIISVIQERSLRKHMKDQIQDFLL